MFPTPFGFSILRRLLRLNAVTHWSTVCSRQASSYMSSTGDSSFRESATNPASKYHIFISPTFDPYVNLSIEHFLLQKSPVNSTILFLYVNSPCVVIGRNQNPWLETNLKLIRESPVIGLEQGLEHVQVVRRRSGGGTVFHDYGNVNYSVICPAADFTRDKHAEMVTRAIRISNPRARVNQRHDIVLDQDSFQEDTSLDPMDMHRTAYHREGVSPSPLKVSGSAYKLTRQRSLHHGTCLLASRNINRFSEYLHSPAEPFMKARGVDSVRSPIGNIHGTAEDGLGATLDFQFRVAEAFADMYGFDKTGFSRLSDTVKVAFTQPDIQNTCSQAMEDISEVNAGIEELMSLDWIYGQTPQFTLSSHSSEEDDRERPPLPQQFPPTAHVDIKVRSGTITSSKLSLSSNREDVQAERERFDLILKGQKVREIRNFAKVLLQADYHEKASEIKAMSNWLNVMFGNPGR